MNQIPGSVQFTELLSRMNASGGFPISIITDSQGLPIAWAASQEVDPERQSAVVAFIQQAANQASSQLGMGEADEFSFHDASGQHLVCRRLKLGETRLILAVMVPDRDHSYRRATSQAIREIQRIWDSFWKT